MSKTKSNQLPPQWDNFYGGNDLGKAVRKSMEELHDMLYPPFYRNAMGAKEEIIDILSKMSDAELAILGIERD